MRLPHLVFVAGLIGALSPIAAAAEEQPQIAVNIGVVSSYTFRGVSQVKNYDPAVQGGADLTYGVGYAGVWASNVNFFNKDHAELDLYGGVRPRAGGFTLDLGGVYYAYPGQPSGADEAYFEFKAGASHPLGPATLGAVVYYSPNYFGPGSQNAAYFEANVVTPVSSNLTFSGAVGRQQIEGPGDYTTWNAGLTLSLGSHLSLDGRYVDTSAHSFGKPYHARAVVGVKATF